jgi:serine/threonine protein kinase
MTHQQPVARPVFKVIKPSIVGDVFDAGLHGLIGLLAADPSRVLKFSYRSRGESALALEREKNILAVLGPHQHIIQLHWASEVGLCFEYCPHGSLRFYYENLRPALPPLSERVRWCHEAAAAFMYIHSKGIVHNDISARNILLSSPSLELKVCDFGFANMVGEEVSGGPETRYGRPELWTQLNSSVKDDLFAVGSLFYEILMGERPYDWVDSSWTSKLLMVRVFPSTDDVRPEGFGEVIRRCWNEEYSSMVEIHNDLLRIDYPGQAGATEQESSSIQSRETLTCSVDTTRDG